MGIQTRAPASFFAGDTITWLVSDAAHLPADGWVMTVHLTNAAGNYSVQSSDNGDGRHLVTFSNADTAAITPGDYTLAVAATKTGERHTIERGHITVQPDPAAASDARSHVKRTLDALEAYLEDAGNLTAASYTIAGRSLARMNPIEIADLHDRYLKKWHNEQNRNRIQAGRKPRRRLLTRMAG